MHYHNQKLARKTEKRLNYNESFFALRLMRSEALQRKTVDQIVFAYLEKIWDNYCLSTIWLEKERLCNNNASNLMYHTAPQY
jgi:hypothetical protein